jgi:hypothetical protein
MDHLSASHDALAAYFASFKLIKVKCTRGKQIIICEQEICNHEIQSRGCMSPTYSQ